jgi:hypothetical protein
VVTAVKKVKIVVVVVVAAVALLFLLVSLLSIDNRLIVTALLVVAMVLVEAFFVFDGQTNGLELRVVIRHVRL